MPDEVREPPDPADSLLVAMTRLRARMRSESSETELGWTWSQLMTLSRIRDLEPTTSTELAHAEHVRRQSMAGTIAALRVGGLVSTSADADDARRSLVRTTAKGRRLLTSIPAARHAWLSAAIAERCTDDQREILRDAAKIMADLADS